MLYLNNQAPGQRGGMGAGLAAAVWRGHAAPGPDRKGTGTERVPDGIGPALEPEPTAYSTTPSGGIVGVASKNTGTSIKIYKEQDPLQRVAIRRHGAVDAGWHRRRRRTRADLSAVARTDAAVDGRGRRRRSRQARRSVQSWRRGGGGRRPRRTGRRARSRARARTRESVTAALTSPRRATRAESAESPCSRASDSRDSSGTPHTPRAPDRSTDVVPVNPVWPNADGEIFVPHEDVGSIVSHPSARDPVAAAGARHKQPNGVGRGEPRVGALERAEHRAREISDRVRRAEQPGMTRGSAQRPAVLVVDLADQAAPSPRIVLGRRN